MKLWLNDTKEGFDGGLVKFCKHCGFHYKEVGKNHVVGWKPGGAFMDPSGMGKMIPKRLSSHCWDSVGSAPSCLHGFISLGLIRRGVTDSFFTDRYALSLVLQHCFVYLLQFED